MARAYAGTVMLEGTTLSEGRGTTRPLELFGAPDIDAPAVTKEMLTLAPQWLRGCRLRNCWFEPTFNKHVGKLCNGVQIHTEGDCSGAISPTSTSKASSPSMSSTAVRYSGIGWTMHARLHKTWIRWLYRMSRLG